MRSARFQQYDFEDDAEQVETKVYFEPGEAAAVAAAPPPVVGQVVYQQPAPVVTRPAVMMPAMVAPVMLRPAVTVKIARVGDPRRRTMITLFAAACVLVGIGIGGMVSATGGRKASAATAPAPAPAPHVVVAPVAAPAPPVVTPIAEAAAPPAPSIIQPAPVAPQPTGRGMLAITTKSPCAIAIDGRPTGVTSPHKLIIVAGEHDVTLSNTEQGVSLTSKVVVLKDQTVTLVQNL